jgi:amidase
MTDHTTNSTAVDRRHFIAAAGAAAAISAAPAVLAQTAAPKARGLEICYMKASELAARIRRKELSAVEVMTAFLDRIDAVNPKVNAIVAMVSREDALKLARQADADLAAGKPVGKFHGLPWAVKDTEDVVGFPTTKGAIPLKNYFPKADSLVVERLRAAGALFIGKSNTPEFAAGSNTINPVYGPTLNPYDLTKTCGGSTGGGAVAVVTGMVPMADGSDTGGSCRNPGAWNNVIGFRPSMGRVPYDYPVGFLVRLPTVGPMARDAADAAFQLSVIAGPDYRDPVSHLDDPVMFTKSLDRDFKGTRVAWTPNLGYLEVDTEIVSVTGSSVPVLKNLGCTVDNAHPDMPEVFETNRMLRGLMFAFQLSSMTPEQRGQIKQSVRWDAAQGEALSGMDVALAEYKRANIVRNVNKFMETYEFLVLPVTQVPPFAVNQEYPTEINGKKMRSYLEWMEIVYAITLTGLPAISVPCGFTAGGLPVGLQIVGRRNDDFGVLQLAHAFEKATKHYERRPTL